MVEKTSLLPVTFYSVPRGIEGRFSSMVTKTFKYLTCIIWHAQGLGSYFYSNAKCKRTDRHTNHDTTSITITALSVQDLASCQSLITTRQTQWYMKVLVCHVTTHAMYRTLDQGKLDLSACIYLSKLTLCYPGWCAYYLWTNERSLCWWSLCHTWISPFRLRLPESFRQVRR